MPIVSLLSEYRDVFALSDSELGQTSLVKHKMELVDPTPIRQRERGLPYAMRESCAMISDYLERKVIGPTSSSSNPIVLLRKNPRGARSRKSTQVRRVLPLDDFFYLFLLKNRKLNSATLKSAGPLQNVDLLWTMGPKSQALLH